MKLTYLIRVCLISYKWKREELAFFIIVPEVEV